MHTSLKGMDRHDNVDGAPKMELHNMKAVSRLIKMFNTVMERTNRYEKARRVLGGY